MVTSTHVLSQGRLRTCFVILESITASQQVRRICERLSDMGS